MSRLASEQSRILRRRMTIQTIVALGIFTIVFALVALMANVMVVPQLAEVVVDQTAQQVRFDPASYVRDHTPTELLERYVRKLQDEGYECEVLWFDGDEALQNARDVGHIAVAAQGAPSDTNMESDEVLDPSIVGEIEIIATSSEEGSIPEASVEQLSLKKLGSYAAWEDARKLEPSKDWDFWLEDANDPYGPFVARDLTTYHAIRLLKLPVALAVYLLGCLVIVLWQMRRSLRYFDELSNAVAGMIADKERPVSLSPSLSVAQGELNGIRLAALADERTAKAAEQRKNELVAYLAHDIRTPLTSILGYLSLMDEAPNLPDDARRSFTHIALSKAERLESLIDEFFEITRYNLQSIPIERSRVNVKLFMEQVADEFFPQAAESHVSIDVQVDAPDDQTFFVDADRLARAIGNVMRNAIAYADPDTTVRLTVQSQGGREGDDASSESWLICVTDYGREISPEHLEAIFEKFYREDGARGAHSGGAGLGLAIAKEIITAHGGSISASSVDRETAFRIVI